MTTTIVRPAGVVTFIRRRPLTSFFLWLFTVGQAFAFAPVVVFWTTGVELPYWQVFVLGSTLVGMLLPAVVITRIVDGPAAVRELWRRAFAVGVPLRWYALAFAAPLLATALAALIVGPPDLSQIGSALVSGLLLQLVLTFVPNNWWEEVAWSGFAQARLQERFGNAAKAALVAGPLFALQHVSLAVAAGWPTDDRDLDLTKTYGAVTAVDDLTVTIQPGRVTGFLGPNGAGKSTTMRAIVGLDRPDAGDVLIGGRRYADDPAPLHTVGALLDARAFHPGRSAHAHLQALAATHGIGRHRVDEVLDMVGLRDVAHRRAGGFSLGMGQRLGIAAALLGDPEVVLLDEPVNGLDPDGVRWIRDLLRRLAGEGRTVFVSSHLMSEMALTADHLVVLGRGRLLADVSLAELTARADGRVLVRSPQLVSLERLLAAPGVTVTHSGPDRLAIVGLSSTEIAQMSRDAGLLLTELTPVHASLEDAYLAMTHADVEFSTIEPGRAAA